MTPDAILRAWFDELWTQGREDTIDRYLAPAAVVHDLPGTESGPMEGRDAFRPFFRRFRGAFPDLRIDVTLMLASGDLAAAYCRVTGTHAGDGIGVPATGRRVDFTGMTMARVEGDQIVEGWNSFDFLTLYQQLGLLPAVA